MSIKPSYLRAASGLYRLKIEHLGSGSHQENNRRSFRTSGRGNRTSGLLLSYLRAGSVVPPGLLNKKQEVTGKNRKVAGCTQQENVENSSTNTKQSASYGANERAFARFFLGERCAPPNLPLIKTTTKTKTCLLRVGVGSTLEVRPQAALQNRLECCRLDRGGPTSDRGREDILQTRLKSP